MVPSLVEFMIGNTDNIRCCIRCSHRFDSEDRWLKIWAKDASLAVGLCDSCAAQAAARSVNMPEREPKA